MYISLFISKLDNLNFFKINIILFLFFQVFHLHAQELPPINSFSPKEYGAESQNWSISQSKENYIYVANNKGLLEYNGATWRIYITPNETIMRSVKVIGKKIFTGFYMDFGYWIKDEKGTLQYNSIANKNNIPLLEDEQFWNIVESDGWVLFQSLNRIYLYNIENDSYKIIESKTQITKIIKVDEIIYFQKFNKGIYKIENGKGELITDSPELINSKLVGIFQKDYKTLFLTQDNGFYYVTNNKLVKWNIPADSDLSLNTIYSCIQLNNGDFVIGTISDGIIYLKKDGTIDYQINQENGLRNNTVLSIFEDAQKNIWLGLDNGINSIDATSSFRIYNDKNGLLGTTYCSALKGDNLYLGTNHGLFYKKLGTNNDFKLIDNTQGQVWSLVEIDNELFCGHDKGTYIIDGDKVKKQINIEGTWDIKKVKGNIYIQGNYDGLYVFEKVGKNFRVRNKIKGFDNTSKDFELYDTNKIFVNHGYKGIYKLTIDKEYRNVLKVEKDTSIEIGISSSLINYNKKLLYSYKKGVYVYNSSTNSFLRDSIYSLFYSQDQYTSGKLIFDKKGNKLWGFSNKDISYFEPGKISNKPTLTKIPILESYRKSATGYENIELIGDQKYLLGTSNGYMTIDLRTHTETEDPTLDINSIKVNTIDKDQFTVNINEYGEFKNSENNLEFNFNVPYFKNFLEPTYKYQLIGHKNNWSDWSDESKILFKNLPSGDYTFNVKVKIGNTEVDKITSYSFSISKPWYLTTLMRIIYLLAIILFSLFMHTIYRTYYKKQQVRVLEKKQQEFELKSLENEQQLMRLKNEKLRVDVENKNRELATATMTAIKKNEFLGTIKKELQSSNEKDVKRVVKIIDKGLNNTDDWTLFKEAFNNADKDFIKKIKVSHPELTPNDLRLCAYLRLNLSSKEIAPLLNISPRSVEVKRYRLRKKMNLSHDKNLTSYILEI